MERYDLELGNSLYEHCVDHVLDLEGEWVRYEDVDERPGLKRYDLELGNSLYGHCVEYVPDPEGEWVRYEDVE